MNTYEKDLNDLKEQILKDGNTLVSKKDLLERFCEIDKEYNGEPWNLLQILANINILVGEETSEELDFVQPHKKVSVNLELSKDAISRQTVNELFNSEIKMYEKRIESRKGSNYHDETERIREFRSRIANAEYWNDKIKSLPPATPTQRWIPVSERLPEPNRAVLTYVNTGKSETFCLANWNDACWDWEEWIGTRMLESEMEYKVLAWMPLPKSYNAETESEE
jgi:hypothetical protein